MLQLFSTLVSTSYSSVCTTFYCLEELRVTSNWLQINFIFSLLFSGGDARHAALLLPRPPATTAAARAAEPPPGGC
jgi:hypothetical protein